MPPTEPPLVFFDASCLIAAASSPNGGSGLLLQLAVQNVITAVVSSAVLAEARRNLMIKFTPEALARHHRQMSELGPLLAPIPDLAVDPRRYPSINVKDEHVVAAALHIGAKWLLTLDRPLLDEINAAGLQIVALTPGDLIQRFRNRNLDPSRP